MSLSTERPMPSEPIEAIDAHGHYGRYDCGRAEIVNEFMTGDAAVVADRARRAKIRLTIVSPLEALLPRGQGDAVMGNRNAARVVEEHSGLLQYVVIDPRHPETYRQARAMLERPKCVGIKIHPEEHAYPINEFGAEIFRFAAEHGAVVLSHSSEQNSLASDLVAWADRFPETTLILGHLGWGWDGDYTHQVRAIQRSRHGNVFTDTSSARSIVPRLVEWAAREIGSDRILFGTDTPLYLAAMQRLRIDQAELTDAEKKQILCENAERLFRLPQ
jgi:predicted TIM-barrel fold metal-dependent hydrolase